MELRIESFCHVVNESSDDMQSDMSYFESLSSGSSSGFIIGKRLCEKSIEKSSEK